MGHAWLQHDGVTYDPVPDLMLPAADYIAKYKAPAITSYSPEEAALVGARSGHFGPWQVLRIKAELASASSLTRSRND
jgi:hypothetical protein